MAEQVLAHQMTAENETTVHRTPANYADHVREMIAAYGNFHLEVQELIAQDDRVYVRWKQTGLTLEKSTAFRQLAKPSLKSPALYIASKTNES